MPAANPKFLWPKPQLIKLKLSQSASATETAKNHRVLTCYGQYYDPLAMINNIPTFYADYADQVQVPDSEVCTQPKPSPTHCLTGWQEHQVWTQGSCTPTSWLSQGTSSYIKTEEQDWKNRTSYALDISWPEAMNIKVCTDYQILYTTFLVRLVISILSTV